MKTQLRVVTHQLKKTAKQKAAEAKIREKLKKDKVGPKGNSGRSGGGDDDTRGDNEDDLGEGGEMHHTPGLSGSTDDERIQSNSGNGSGGIKTIIREQVGGATGAGEHR